MTTLPADGQPIPGRNGSQQPDALPEPDTHPHCRTRPGEGTVWVRCSDYLAHRTYHRRDALNGGAWRCYECHPIGEVAR